MTQSDNRLVGWTLVKRLLVGVVGGVVFGVVIGAAVVGIKSGFSAERLLIGARVGVMVGGLSGLVGGLTRLVGPVRGVWVAAAFTLGVILVAGGGEIGRSIGLIMGISGVVTVAVVWRKQQRQEK